MERRNHARVAVNLKAALINAQSLPMRCRIRDVSSGGILLQHERHDKAATFHVGDTVEIRLSLKQGDERTVIPLPMTVRRVEENGIAAEFLRPQTQLMSLIEPYRLDQEETRQIVANQGREQVAAVAANITASPPPTATSTRASRRRFAVQRARVQLAETMKTAGAPAHEKKQPAPKPTPAVNPVTGKANRGLFYVGLLSLVAAVGILLLDFSGRTHSENRISALESAIERQASALTLLRARLASSDIPGEELAELNTRVETLATSFAALETRIMQDAGQVTILSTNAAPSTSVTLTDDTQPEKGRPATDTPGKSTPPAQPQSISNDGPWVINLLSLYDETAAKRFAEKARARDVRADANRFAVQGRKPVWRIQVGGFSTRDEASAYADASKEKLGLKSVWIFNKGQ